MKSSKLVGLFLSVVLLLLFIVGFFVYNIDPFFHYHKPDTDNYYYQLNNERSQNDGITKHFDYNAIITGTSMTENFKTSELDALFNVSSVKIPYSAATYNEVNNNLQTAFDYNPDIRIVVRCLDMTKFFDACDELAYSDSSYPNYLYDSNPFNDVKYLFNHDVLFNRILPMLLNRLSGETPGITSFDSYANWSAKYTYGKNTVLADTSSQSQKGGRSTLTDADRQTIRDNIQQNVIALANAHPDTTFYYFFTPYSIAWWKVMKDEDTLNRQIDAEQYIIELILACDNIRLFSFNLRDDIITDLNNYKDPRHYGEWINSLMLKWMHDGQYMLTPDNYLAYIAQEKLFFSNYDYSSINEQIDYENDDYAAALLNQELTGANPVNLLELYYSETNHPTELSIHDSAEIQCDINSSVIINISSDILANHSYLSFYGKRDSDVIQPSLQIYDESGSLVYELAESMTIPDTDWHHYLIDVSELSGNLTVIISCYSDNPSVIGDSLFYCNQIYLY